MPESHQQEYHLGVPHEQIIVHVRVDDEVKRSGKETHRITSRLGPEYQDLDDVFNSLPLWALQFATSATNAEIAPFSYEPLDATTKEIRLLRLGPVCEHGLVLQLHIQTFALDDAPSFLALSYVWGSPHIKAKVKCDGGGIGVGASLLHALLETFRRYPSGWLWADAICMDQSNLTERAHQVMMMGKIYRKATLVVTYPGSGYDKFKCEFNEAFDCNIDCQNHMYMREEAASFGSPQKAISVMNHLTRIWKSSTGTISELDWAQHIPDITTKEGKEIRVNAVIFGLSDWYSCSRGWTFQERLRIADQTQGHDARNNEGSDYAFALSRNQRGKRISYLLELLRLSKINLSSDPRDKIYTLLDMAEDEISRSVVVDYSPENTATTLCIDMARRFIDARFGVDTLHFSGLDQTVQGLPTWVPDWTKQSRSELKATLYHCTGSTSPKMEFLGTGGKPGLRVRGYTSLVLVNRREYQTDLAYESDHLAKENAAMRALMACRNFSVNGGILARNGIVQGLLGNGSERQKKSRHSSSSHSSRHRHSGHASSSSSDGSTSVLSRRSSITSISSLETLKSVSSDSLHQSHTPPKTSKAKPIASKDRPTTGPIVSSEQSGDSIHTAGLKEAISSHDFPKTKLLLEQSFSEVAVDEYSWVTELKQLGYSPGEIADELLEKSIHGPWIFEPFERPDAQPYLDNLHQAQCVHGPCTVPRVSLSKENTDPPIMLTDPCRTRLTIKENIEYFCGLGGARPVAGESDNVELGSAIFENNNSMAIVSLDSSAVQTLLMDLECAARVLQDIGGCCDSFTFLYASRHRIELHKVELSLIRQLTQQLKIGCNSELSSELFERISGVLPWVAEEQASIDWSTLDSPCESLYSLVAQFLSLALLSYAQSHCGSICPFFLDTPVESVVLTGQENLETNTEACCLVGSLVELTCMGGMVVQPVFAFHFLPCFDQAAIQKYAGKKFDLFACPEDVLDTWGPGELVGAADNPELLYAISIGGGTISAVKLKDSDALRLHWSRAPVKLSELEYSFSRRSKIIIGAMVTENRNCQADSPTQLKNAVTLLEEIGTCPTYWELSERQFGLGIQGGQAGIATFQFNQTWVKRGGLTKKSTLLSQQAIYTADLESLFAVQVSVCTGIARRVRLRDLLADVMPCYIEGILTKPPLWKSLNDDFKVLQALREDDLKVWIDSLDHDHQVAFENIVLKILFLLRDTGIDRTGQNFVIACIQPDIPFQCLKVPCKKENYWARILADSEEIATFAYVTTRCLETNRISCRGLAASWANSTALLWTAVSCYEDRLAAASSSNTAQWFLKHSEAYLIGRPDTALFVQVDRPDSQAEPRLLVSLSTIPRQYLYRIYRKGKLRRLREKKAFDDSAENVIILVSQGGKIGRDA
ncbi:heterokaryon incompatibility protein-domain-containing protein [Hypoxylon rubiginosum]|uniref:Heterokaryon incompatibility protein-domain-containing protein n=1 Tax=Hypoxylon rubiginosum TaxID=110542 RepID=A0ACC0DD63_9PEZI|nr:heterokaryon incompatibility protein-domain-containing protein [Hypoxylon rubiginosum]